MYRKPSTWWPWALVLVGVVLLANAPVLDEFAGLLGKRILAASSSDAATHYFRLLQARDLYLPSGHRWGWEPFWFQGYVPFLLYPELPYLLLATIGMAFRAETARLFNVYTVAVYLALPLVASFPILRSTGILAAAVVAGWFSVTTAYGAGLASVFVTGLLSQQVGTLLFTALSYDLIVARRLDRAAIWLGLLPLVHVHSSLIAGVVWIAAGLVALWSDRNRAEAMRDWIVGSFLAALIASPTILGLFYGWGQIGDSTTFSGAGDLLSLLLRGHLFAPWPVVVAMALCLGTSAAVAPRSQRKTYAVYLLVGLGFLVASLIKVHIGWPFVERIVNSMLYLRTLSFAFVWLGLLAVCWWARFPRAVQMLVVALTLLGVAEGWSNKEYRSSRIGVSWGGKGEAAAVYMRDYRMALDWIFADAAGEISTVAVALERKPIALPLFTAVQRTGLPLLNGHGIELTSVRNNSLAKHALAMPCTLIQLRIRDYAIGYIVGTNPAQRRHLQQCLEIEPSFTRGRWWTFATGKRWATSPESAIAFTRNATWTTLEWTLQRRWQSSKLRLPMANTAPWVAEVDGAEVPIESGPFDMMRVTVPAGARRLRLRYLGYAGEWGSVAVGLLALVLTVRRARLRARSSSTD